MILTNGNYFIRIASACPRLHIGEVNKNIQVIENIALEAAVRGSCLVVFPELCITGYSCGDLFSQSILLHKSYDALLNLTDRISSSKITAVVGLPVSHEGKVYNCAAVISQGRVEGLIPKSYLPNAREYYEQRWFSSGASYNKCNSLHKGEIPFGVNLLFSDRSSDLIFGVEICEDLWAVIPPSSYCTLEGANLILNLSASNETIGKADYRRELVRHQSARCHCAYAYSSAGIFESTGDTIYSGHCLIAENGRLLKESAPYSLDDQLIVADIDISNLIHDRLLNSSFRSKESISSQKIEITLSQAQISEGLMRPNPSEPFLPYNPRERNIYLSDILNIQISGLARRLIHTGLDRVIIGLSGGLDSTWAAIVVAKTFDKVGLSRANIIAVTMPGFGSTERTKTNAHQLAYELGLSLKVIDIKEIVKINLESIEHNGKDPDITFENAQARQRTLILMNLANKNKGIVVGTGNMSEAALGWCTFSGDHISMYHINIGVPKTVIRALVEWSSEVGTLGLNPVLMSDIVNTPISPELLPTVNGIQMQESESIAGPFDLNDFFLFHFLRYGAEPEKIKFLAVDAFKETYCSDEVNYWLGNFLQRFFSQQFKRAVMPEGPKIGSIALSPRADWRMPSEANAGVWLATLE